MKHYEYPRKECWDELTKNVRVRLDGKYVIDADTYHGVKYMLLAKSPIKEKKVEEDKICKGYCKCPDCHILGEKYGNIPVPTPTQSFDNKVPEIKLPRVNNNFTSMEQYEWAKKITEQINRLNNL